jgi:hypothetical protein
MKGKIMPEMEKAKSLESIKLNKPEEDAVAATQAGLDALGIGGDEPAEPIDSTPEPEPVVKDDGQAEPVKPTPEPEPKAEGKENTEEVSLPDAYYRAAVRQGMEDGEIKEMFEANPEVAIRVLGKIYEASNKISDDFAAMGRAKLKPADTTTVVKTATEVNAGKKVDLAALKEEYGADSSIVKFAEDLQVSILAPTVRDEPVSQTYGPQNHPIAQPQNVPLDPRVEVMVNQFFTADTLKPYKDFYGEGKDVNKLTMEQNQRRYDVLDRADEIISGAYDMGRPITADEAMDRAHALISAPVQKQALRVEFKAMIVKKSRGVTLKPAKSKTAVPVKDAKTAEKDLEVKVEAQMDKIGLR